MIFRFLPQQKIHALIYLVTLHLLIIVLSNYLVQMPISIFNFNTTWGVFSFPFIFLATDLTVAVFGVSLARKIIFIVMIPALLISYFISSLFYQGEWQGFGILKTFNIFEARIACASFIAYILGQILDVQVFNYLKRQIRWWVAPIFSTLLGSAFDTAVFFFIAFYQSSDLFINTHLIEIAIVDYIFKLLINIVFFLPLYGIAIRIIIRNCII